MNEIYSEEQAVKIVSALTGVGEAAVEDVLRSAGALMRYTLADGDRISFPGFGLFKPNILNPRYLNDGTVVPAKITPIWRPSKKTRRIVDSGVYKKTIDNDPKDDIIILDIKRYLIE